jgi:CBS domain-containing protein
MPGKGGDDIITTVRQMLQKKGRDVVSIAPHELVYKALELMSKKDVGAVLVMEGEKIVGIFTERDYARRVILKGKSSKNTAVRDLMVKNVLYVTPEKTVEDCMCIMTSKRVRHLPVLENGKLVGIISIGDVVNAIISEQEFTIHELEKYITGSGYA